ncbi:uncharacterized protein LOC119613852, partial [Lucilia sericata]|uniref:uncharacterized protein LOC119613852 n=1 Tax=Lucilia sericata TaxID=13632 RepID=UPI0018A86A2B
MKSHLEEETTALKMTNYINFLICLICLPLLTAKKYAIYTHLECPQPHVEIVTDYNCTLVKNSKGFLTMNTGFKFKRDLHNIMANFQVKIKRGPTLYETYLNMNIDICEALSAAHKHFLLKMISLEILRTSNLPLECPLKK